VVGVIIMLIIAALLAVWPRGAKAQDSLTAVNGPNSVTLWDSPCVHGETLWRISTMVAPQFRDKFRKARAMVGGKDYFGCWIVEGDMVHLIYEDGDQGLLPIADFAPGQPTNPSTLRKPDA
jgi:hypothetical protein